VPLDGVKNKLVTGEQPAIEDKRNRPFEAAWRELPYRYRQVLDWRYHEKCSHEEIGHRLGVSPDAAKHLYRRAMRKLSDDAHKHEKE
jgi:RNA polymerase sigma factor (sigma-70 family)